MFVHVDFIEGRAEGGDGDTRRPGALLPMACTLANG
jgi:hypothetical protein